MRLAWAAVFSILLLTGCGEELSVEQHIIANLQAMETAAEEGEHFEFMGYVADSFEGQLGSMDRREFHRFMIFQLNKKRRLHAQFFPIYVTETGDTLATANFNLLVTGGKGLLPESGQLFDVKTQWLLNRSDWLLQKADWEAMRLTDKLPVN
jgi:hypothetical protein